MTDPLVTIAVPFYNAERHIADALAGACNQTHRNIELLLLNDGSTDNSDEIARNVLKDHPKHRIITQPNKGIAHSRNRLIEEASGAFFFFLDADDVVEVDAIERLLKVAEATDSEMVMSSYFRIREDGTPIVPATRIGRREWGPRAAYLEFLRHEVIKSYLWGTLFRMSLLRRGIFFPEDRKNFTDMAVMPDILTRSNKVIYVDELLYGYRHTPTGLVRSADAAAWHNQLDFLLSAGRYVANNAEGKLHDALILSHLKGITKQLNRLGGKNQKHDLKLRIGETIKKIGFSRFLLNGDIRFSHKKALLKWYFSEILIK